MRIMKVCWALTILNKKPESREFLSYHKSGIPNLYPSRDEARLDARTLETTLEPRPAKVHVVAFL